ncbi:MAG TPA: hypothetical protein VHQ23_06600 [Ilumatobacteraceae bacterium]|jgi:hypothetical protein|nr:hypothetical protein [Ilumatobacteraceae bacterium]
MTTANTTPIVGLVGYGVTGRRIGARLVHSGTRVAVYDPAGVNAPRGAVHVGQPSDLAVTDVVVLSSPHPHAQMAAEFLANGVSVVSLSADVADVRTLVELDHRARRGNAALIVGAAMSPGLSGLLADHLCRQLYVAEEIHVATHGTAGPACAARHHDALGDTAIGWHDGAWIERPGGSGRELNWFPEPIGARDCYRASLPDPILLHRMFPTASRISARVSSTRRDRLTARLPMLTPPHAAGDIGAVRVEVRGAAADGARVTLIAGASGPTGDLAAAVASACIETCLAGGAEPGVHLVGGASLDAPDLLRRAVDLGVVLQEFTGVARSSTW